MKKPPLILWSAQSRSDLLKIAERISQDKKEAAIHWLEKVEQKVLRLKQFPLSGRIVPELSRPEIREIIVGSYRVIYKYALHRISILSVFHSAKSMKTE